MRLSALALLAAACATTPVPPPAKPAAPPVPAMPERPAYPPSRRDDVKDVLHGVTVADPYRWLEDAKSPAVQQWMKDEDALTRAYLAKIPGREALRERLAELSYVDVVTAPIHRGGRWFLWKRDAKQEKGVVYVRDGKEGPLRPLLDPNGWSKDGSVALGGWSVDWQGARVAYQVKPNNSDEATLLVMDVATGQVRDRIEGGKYAQASWTPKGDGFYYTWLPSPSPKIPEADRPGYAEVRFHHLGDDPAKDRVVREANHDPTAFLNADLSRDGRFLVLSQQHGWTSVDVWFRDLTRGKTGWTPLAVGNKAIYDVWVWKDRFYVLTNEGAPRYRMFAVDPAHPERAAWREIVPERKDATLEAFSIVGGKLALHYLKDVASRLELRELDGRPFREIALPGLGASGAPVGLEDDDDAYYTFTSFTYPTEIFETSVATGKTTSFFQVKAPVDPSKYEVEQVFFTSKDGTRVPMFVVHAKGAKPDGEAPAILYGYGGFQIALTPSFNASIFPWLERGGVYAIANLRGGSEYGEAWHEHGMRLEKQHVFDDFEAAAEKLIHDGWTTPARLAAEGGSNGGLLVGAALTQRPELFRVALCAVPLLDMVRYHLFGSGKTWIEEYGSADDPQQFAALYAYSPYHHVTQGVRYPATLLLSADADDRVDPMHARKMAAELQRASTGGPVLLRIEKHSGHGGADLVKARVEQTADMYAFALAAMGLAK